MIAELLTQGIENARTGRELANILHVDLRVITMAINKERRQGAPICAATSTADGLYGYYLASNKDEMQGYCERLKHREREIAKMRRACAASIASLPEADNDEYTDEYTEN